MLGRRVVAVGTAMALWTGALGAAGAAGEVSVGRSGWFWSSPQPQGRDLTAVGFSGPTGYAVGRDGTLLRSDDGGSTWAGLRGGGATTFLRVDTVDPNTFVAAGLCRLRRSVDGGRTLQVLRWTSNEKLCDQRSGDLSIVDVSFPTPAVGYLALADGTVLRTTDGGSTWARATSPGLNILRIAFADPQTGLVASGTDILRTADGGQSWSRVYTPSVPAPPFLGGGLTWASPTVAYATGGPGLLRSDDAGRTWKPADATSFTGGLLSCGSVSACVLGGNGGLSWTADSGATFASVKLRAPMTPKAVSFASPSGAVLVGDGGATGVSGDGGASFDVLGRGLGYSLYRRVVPVNSSTALLLGDAGALARTTDGGRTWTESGAPSSSNLVDAAFPTPVLGFVLDGSGAVLGTANAGATWAILRQAPGTGDPPPPAAIAATDARHVALAGPRGIRASSDGGNSFEAVGSSAVARARLTGAAAVRGTLFAWGPAALLRSGDGGGRWTALRRPSGSRLVSVSFTDARTGWALDAASRLYRTTDAGRRWREDVAFAVPGGSWGARAISFGSGGRGWALAPFDAHSAGWVMRTSDAGRTWRPQLLAARPAGPVSAVAALSGNAALAIGSKNRAGALTVFATSTGGDAPTASTISLGALLPRRGLTRVALRRRHRRVIVTGRLRPGLAGESIRLALRGPGRTARWVWRNVRTVAGGAFSYTARVSRTTVVVARWGGDDLRSGAGSPVLTLRVR